MPKPEALTSELFMPFTEAVLDNHLKRISWAKKNGADWELRSECIALWSAALCLRKLGQAQRSERCGPNGFHFSMAICNEIDHLAGYIEHLLGCDPRQEKDFEVRPY